MDGDKQKTISQSTAGICIYAERMSCWFHGSSLEGFSIVFPVFWLAKVESSQMSNELGFLDIFSRHICSAVTETIRGTNYATSFAGEKCLENQVRSCWDDSWSVEPTSQAFSNRLHWRKWKHNILVLNIYYSICMLFSDKISQYLLLQV